MLDRDKEKKLKRLVNIQWVKAPLGFVFEWDSYIGLRHHEPLDDAPFRLDVYDTDNTLHILKDGVAVDFTRFLTYVYNTVKQANECLIEQDELVIDELIEKLEALK